MLPSNLFSAKVLKGKVSPKYLALDGGSVVLAKEMIAAFQQSVGKKRAFLTEKLGELETRLAGDYKIVRGLASILDRRCTYIVDSKLEPMSMRTAVFEESSKRRFATQGEREQLLVELSAKMNVTAKELEDSLFKDLEDEQILSSFDAVDPELLVKVYNLSLAQTALFKSVSMEFIASGNWKRIFREIKRLGLMYGVEKKAGEDLYMVHLDGPLSLFKMTERYGTSLAKLLPTIVSGDSWSFKAELIERHKNNRIFHFEESRNTAPEFASLFEEQLPSIFDSSVEEKFASNFNSLNTGWDLRREPEPLIAGRHVLIPDFSFEKHGMKLFMEIVGFWTKEYLERKLSKLSSLSRDIEMIVAVNENLRCSESKLSSLKSALLLTYSKEVPLEPIVSHLRALEEKIEERQVEELRNNIGIAFTGDSVNLQDVAKERGVPPKILQRTLDRSTLSGYRMIGDYLLSESKIESIKRELGSEELTLSKAVQIVKSLDVGANPEEVIRSLGFVIEWDGLDYERSKVKRMEGSTSLK